VIGQGVKSAAFASVPEFEFILPFALEQHRLVAKKPAVIVVYLAHGCSLISKDYSPTCAAPASPLRGDGS
jgi:hypothetical protein